MSANVWLVIRPLVRVLLVVGLLAVLQCVAQRLQRAVQCDLDGVRLHVEHLADLARGEVGAVAQRDQFPVARAEERHRLPQIEPEGGVRCELARGDLLRDALDGNRPLAEVLADAAPGDPDQPGCGVAAAGVEPVAVAQRALERGRGDVLGVGAVPDPVGDVGVDPPDQRLRVGERVAVSHRLRLTAIRIRPAQVADNALRPR